MREYNKKFENELDTFVGLYGFVKPIPIDYPEDDGGELNNALYGFMSKFKKKEFQALEDIDIVKILNSEYIHEAYDDKDDSHRKMPCTICVEPFQFKFKDLTVVIFWNHGFIAKNWWKWVTGKWIYYSGYKLRMFHSDDTEINVDTIPLEKIKHMLEELPKELLRQLDAIEEKHKRELESL